MIQETINGLKEKGLIAQEDIVIACMDAPSQSAMFWGGAIGAAISQANAARYILSANEQEFRLFEIEKNTGEYMGRYNPIPKEDIKKLVFSMQQIIIKTQSAAIRLLGAPKIKIAGEKIVQKEEIKRLKLFIKSMR